MTGTNQCFIYLLQSRKCFEKIPQVKPGQKSMVRGIITFFLFLLVQIRFDRSECIWFPVFNLHCSRIPVPGRSGGGERESGADCDAGVGRRSGRSQEHPPDAEEAGGAGPSAFVLLRRSGHSVWGHHRLWVSLCVSLPLNPSDSTPLTSPPPFNLPFHSCRSRHLQESATDLNRQSEPGEPNPRKPAQTLKRALIAGPTTKTY